MSQAVIGNLRATLGMDSAQFEAGAKKARGTLAGLRADFRAFAGAVGGALAIEALGRASVQALKDVAELGDLAETIGITAEQVQVYNRMALASGASTEVMARGLQSITEQSTQAGSALGKLFEANGFDAKAMNANQAILTFMDLLQRARTPAEQLQMATSVLGDKVGRQLVEAMRAGAAGYDQATKDMIASGIYHTNVEVARIQQIEQEYNQVTANIATMWQAMIVKMATTWDSMVASSSQDLELLSRGFDRLTSGDWAGGLDDLRKALIRFDGEDLSVPGLLESAPGKGDLQKPPVKPSFLPPETTKQVKEAKAALDEMAEAGKRVWEDTRTPLEQYQLRIRELNDLLSKGKIDQDTYNRAVAQAQEAFNGAAQGAETLADKVGEELTDVFSTWIDDAIDGTFKLKDALGELARELAKGTFRSLLSSILGGGANAGGGGLLSGLFGGLFGGFSGLYASGGTMGPGQWGIAGEAGPEIITGPATVTPFKGLDSSSEIHIVLHPTKELWAEVDSKVMAGSQQAVRVSVAESARQAQRSFGSTYRDNQVRKF